MPIRKTFFPAQRLIFLLALILSGPSYAQFVCDLGTCTQQCTDPDSVIGTQPLPSRPDINNGNYVDCIYACIDLKQQLFCSDGTQLPWIEGEGDDLSRGNNATIPVYQKGTFKAYVDPFFTPLDREQIKAALDIVYEYLAVSFLSDPVNSAFGKCTEPSRYEAFAMSDLWGANFFDVNTYGYANIWREPRQPYQRLIPGFPGIKYDLRIVKLWSERTNGKATLGNQSVARPVIALNWNKLKGYSGNKVKQQIYSQPEFWAMVIAHEMLHTVGYTHPERGAVPESTYLDTFMVKFANCISVTALPPDLGAQSKLSSAD